MPRFSPFEGLRYEEQIKTTLEAVEREAIAAVEVLKINPMFFLERYTKTLHFKNRVDIDRTIEALRKAGLK